MIVYILLFQLWHKDLNIFTFKITLFIHVRLYFIKIQRALPYVLLNGMDTRKTRNSEITSMYIPLNHSTLTLDIAWKNMFKTFKVRSI